MLYSQPESPDATPPTYIVDDERLKVLNVPWDQASLISKRNNAVANPQAGRDALQKEEDTFAYIQHNSGTMLAGTDSPLDNVATALHLNLRGQALLGHLPPWRALQSATKLPAEQFSLAKDLGTIEPGKLADLVFLGGDPLQDIRRTRDVRRVMRGGRIYDASLLGVPQQAPR